MPRSTRRDRGTTTVNANSPPAPFAKAAERLNPFLDTLDPERLYIVHLDRLPWEFKRQIFAVPVFLNVVIVIILLWRWYTIVPAYLELAAHFLRASPSINASFAEKVWLTLRRAVMFGIDFVLIRIIMPWPISFFLEQPANPVKWRRRVRFQDVEIIVRESRAWGAEELLRGGKKGEESPFFKTRVLPAVERRLLTEKTGYSMMGKDWDLDFASMINAAELCRKKELEEQDFETTVLAHDEVLGWLSWVVYKDEQAAEVNDRDKLVNFKDRLTLLGKESLFFRWIEIIQYESTQPGGLSGQRRVEVMNKAREIFQAQGIDFDDFVATIGGIEAFPGLDQTGT